MRERGSNSYRTLTLLSATQPALSKDLRSLFKSLDFASAGGAALAASDEEDEAIIEEDSEDDDEDDDEEDSEESEEEEEPATAPVVKAAKEEKKESKHDREERRKVERELEKAQLAAQKAVVREEKATVKLPVVKSPWVSAPSSVIADDTDLCTLSDCRPYSSVVCYPYPWTFQGSPPLQRSRRNPPRQGRDPPRQRERSLRHFPRSRNPRIGCSSRQRPLQGRPGLHPADSHLGNFLR